jgi:hypothetical protein
MVAVGIVAVIVWAILTYMGTPAYRAQAPAAEEIALEFVPYDREGKIHEVPWDELIDGTYSTENVAQSISLAVDPDQIGLISNQPEHLTEFMFELAEAMEAESEDLPGGVAEISIRIWQRELKRVDIEITWQEEGEERELLQHTYIHRAFAP